MTLSNRRYGCWSSFQVWSLLLMLCSVVCGQYNHNASSLHQQNSETQSCVVAKIKCALRNGCGRGLKHYMLECYDLMHGKIDYCNVACRNSLIALTSSEEGYNLMTCQCDDNNCQQIKDRIEVCKEEVMAANSRNAIVSCNVAQLICAADTQCSTALGYYDRLCRAMVQGHRCTSRCNNSISILQRQTKAQKLETCLCDGTESFNCKATKTNMANLCFPQTPDQDNATDVVTETNENEQNETTSQPPDITVEDQEIILSPIIILLMSIISTGLIVASFISLIMLIKREKLKYLEKQNSPPKS